jgi:hypothetical protein
MAKAQLWAFGILRTGSAERHYDCVEQARKRFFCPSVKVPRGRATFEPSPCHRLEQIYFLTFVFLVRAADP